MHGGGEDIFGWKLAFLDGGYCLKTFWCIHVVVRIPQDTPYEAFSITAKRILSLFLKQRKNSEAMLPQKTLLISVSSSLLLQLVDVSCQGFQN